MIPDTDDVLKRRVRIINCAWEGCEGVVVRFRNRREKCVLRITKHASGDPETSKVEVYFRRENLVFLSPLEQLAETAE